MIKKLVCCLLIIFLFTGCNVSDYNHGTKASDDVKQICDDKTKICYPVGEEPNDGQNVDDFDKEFEKLKQIVADMNENETKKVKEETDVANKNETSVENKEETKVAKPTEMEYIGNTRSDRYMSVFEGELVKLNVKTVDPDGDNVSVRYSEPLDENGEWQTEEGDIGKYNLYVTVSDGAHKQTKRILLEVKKYNLPPKLEPIKNIEIYEGDTIKLNPEYTDPDNDPMTIAYTGWMTQDFKKTGYSDAGKHNVTITVTDDDGETAVEVVEILVKDKNRAPIIEDITLG